MKYLILVAALSLALFAELWSCPSNAETKSFSVIDYGAKSDGSADAQSAIAKAISAAKAWVAVSSTRHASITFPAGNFSLEKPTHIFAISIADAANLTLSGAACHSWVSKDCTHLIGAPATLNTNGDPLYNSFFEVKNSSNINIENFYLEKTKPYFTQGQVERIDRGMRTVVLKVDRGFSDFSDPLVRSRFNLLMVFSDAQHPFWDHSQEACSGPGSAADDGNGCSMFHILSTQKTPDALWTIRLDKVPPSRFIRKPFLVWRNVGWQAGILVSNVRNLSIDNIFYTGGGGPAVHVQQSTGDLAISNVTVGVPPASGQLFAATSGFNGSSNRGKIILDHVVVKHTDDDGFHFSAGSYFPVLDESEDRKTIRVALCYDGQFQSGDLLAAWNWREKHEIGRARVQSVTIVTDRDPGKYHRTCDISLNTALPMLTNLRTYSDKNLGVQDDSNDRVLDLSLNPFLIVRDSYLSSMRARCGIVQTSALIENNICANTPAAGLLIGPEYAWGEGYAVDGVKISNNIFNTIGGTAIYIADVSDSIRSPTAQEMLAKTRARQIRIDNQNITISGNRFENLGMVGRGIMGIQGAAITVANSKDVSISKNIFGPDKQSSGHIANQVIIAPASTSSVSD